MPNLIEQINTGLQNTFKKPSVSVAAPAAPIGPQPTMSMAPAISPIMSVSPTVPKVSTTTISNANKIAQVPVITQKLETLSDRGVRTDPVSGVATLANGTVASAPEERDTQGLLVNPVGAIFDRNTGNKIVSNTTATSSGADLPLNTLPQIDTRAEDEVIIRNLDEMQRMTDSTTADLLENIKQKFNQRKNEQTEVNMRQGKAINNALLMGGATGKGSSSQFAPISSQGIIGLQESFGIKQLAALDSEEADLIAQAKAAQASGNFKILEAKNAQIEKKRQEKIDYATKLNNQITEANNKARESAITASRDTAVADLYAQGVTDVGTLLQVLNDGGGDFTAKEISETLKSIVPPGLDDLVKTLRTNGAPPEVVQAVLSSPDMATAYQNAGSYAAGGTGIVGEYNFAVANGYTGSFSQYQNEDANRKIRVQAASQNPDRILTATEAQALGVPFGTMASQAYGKTVSKPLTDEQLKNGLFASRVEDANGTISGLESSVSNMNSASFNTQRALENTTIGNTVVSDEIKQIRQAERNFATAVLRRESGAAISATEFETLEKQYFPRPGDDEKTLQQKSKNREVTLKNLIKSSGPAYGGEVSTPSVLQSEDQAKQYIITYGTANPDQQEIITQLVNEGRPFLEIKEVLGL